MPAPFVLVGPATYVIPARTSKPDVVTVSIPVVNVASPRPVVAVTRVTTPSGEDATQAFAVSWNAKDPVLDANVTLSRIPLPGNYMVRLSVTMGTDVSTVEVTFARPAPKLEVSPFVFDCIGRHCALVPDHVMVSESSGTSLLSHLQVQVRAPLKGPDGVAVPAPDVGSLEVLEAGTQKPLNVLYTADLPLGTTSGVAVVHTDQTADYSAPVEIRHKLPCGYLVLALTAGFIVNAIVRFVLKGAQQRYADRAKAKQMLRSIEARAHAQEDKALGAKLAEPARALFEAIKSGDLAAIRTATETSKAQAESILTQAAADRASLYADFNSRLQALVGRERLPRDARDTADVLVGLVRRALSSLDHTSIEEARKAQSEQVVVAGQVTDKIAAFLDEARSARELVGAWQIPELDGTMARLKELEQLQPKDRGDLKGYVDVGGRLAEELRIGLFGARLRDILKIATDARTELTRRGVNGAAIQQGVAKAVTAAAADVRDVRAMGEAVSELRAALAKGFEALAAAPPELLAAARKGDFAAATGLASQMAPPQVAMAFVPPAGQGGTGSIPPHPQPTPIEPAATPPPPPRTDTWLPEILDDGGPAAVVLYFTYALLIGAGAYYLLEPSFVGTPRDFLVALFSTFGVNVGASSAATATAARLQGNVR